MNLSVEKERLASLGLKIFRFSEISKMRNKRGTYTLMIYINSPLSLKIGGLGIANLNTGYYTYTGSALGRGPSSLAGRISRHLRSEKKRRWHIDYLLRNGESEIEAVLALLSRRRLECEVNQHLISLLRPKMPILGFGSSDCISGCKSHLLYFGKRDNLLSEMAEIYLQRGKDNVFALLKDEAWSPNRN
ncbi:GIY-YIG nuclease family protein [Candidatus Bathyarchaeota archaeon]|nr:MAG: GIY-YIG nuclease family protein [Candidatus Bathyarchaeota archaeon]